MTRLSKSQWNARRKSKDKVLNKNRKDPFHHPHVRMTKTTEAGRRARGKSNPKPPTTPNQGQSTAFPVFGQPQQSPSMNLPTSQNQQQQPGFDPSQSSGTINPGEQPKDNSFLKGLTGERPANYPVADPANTDPLYALGALLGIAGGGISKAEGIESLLTKSQIGTLDKTIGLYGKGKIPLNTKTAKLVTNILQGKFSKKALIIAGGWASAIFLGKWAQAESSEPLTIQINKMEKYATDTGDWSTIEEAQKARDEILDLHWWQKVALWSPISPFIGIPKKVKGAIQAAKINDEYLAN